MHQSQTGNIVTVKNMDNSLLREDITDNIVIIKINRLYRSDMTDEELYEATRGVWKRKIESVENADYALSVAFGKVKEVYKIFQWLPAGTIPMKTRNIDPDHCVGRIEFNGEIASGEIRSKYIGKDVSKLFKFGEANPVKVFVNH